MLKERFFATHQVTESQSPPTSEKPTPPEIRSQHDLWRADIIAQRYSQLPSFRQNLRSALTEDIQHLCREDLLQEKHITWQEDISDRGIEGNGYGEVVRNLTQNYIAYSAKEFGNISRAMTEHVVMANIESWALETADKPGNFVVWLSPPGPEYFGISSFENWQTPEKFCTKINIKWAEKTIDPQTQTEKIVLKSIQLTGWPNLAQLVNFWEDLNQKPLPNTDRAEILTDLIGNLTYFSDPRFTPEKMLAHVSDLFFQTQNSWQHAVEMPQVNPEDFWPYEETLWQKFYWPKASQLLAQIPIDLPADALFWGSEKYRKIIESLDVLFHFFYRHLRNELDQPDGKNFQNVSQKLKLLEQEYKADIAIRIQGKKVSQKDLDKHNLTVASLISVTNRASSLTQCGLLAPFTTPLSMAKGMSGMSGLGVSSRFGGAEHSETYLDKINSVEYQTKLAEYQRIQAGDYQEVQLVVNGEPVHYMVPASFLEGKGCFVAMVDGQEVAMGPCDIPLDAVFEDPNENIVYKMDKFQFADYTNQLKNYLFTNEFNRADQTLAENPNLSPTEKERAKRLLQQLEKKILKPTIGLSEFVSGARPLADDAAFYLPGQLLHQLQKSLNPLRFLEELVFSTTVFSASSAL